MRLLSLLMRPISSRLALWIVVAVALSTARDRQRMRSTVAR
jgi:hypothetical protein